MTNIRNPRHYWVGLPDEELIEARVEYRRFLDEGTLIDTGVVRELFRVIGDIGDELERRAEYRARFTGGAA